jgi:anti-sigma B factor antagonist
MRAAVSIQIEPALNRDGGSRANRDVQQVRIAVVGELDGLVARPLQRAILDTLRQYRPREITIDLGDVTFLDTGGLNALVTSRADARQVDCQLHIINPRPLVYRVLRIVGLLELFGLDASQRSTSRSRRTCLAPTEPLASPVLSGSGPESCRQRPFMTDQDVDAAVP